MIGQVKKAVEENKFTVHYQPIIDLKTMKVDSYEALARLEIEGKNITPSIFIPIVEENNLIKDFTLCILKKIVEENKTFRTVAINISPLFIEYGDWYIYILKSFFFRYDNLQLKLEITEYPKLQITETLINDFIFLQRLGIEIGLDDYGEGHSNLSYLCDLPVDFIKIDRSIISNIEKNKSIISSTIDMCHKINVKVVAEGVENELQLNVLKLLNCDFAQGFYFN